MAIIITGSNNDTINGTSGADQISSDGGNDVINAGGGNDIVLSGSGNDTVDGGAGEDFVDGGDGNDRLFGGAGNDIILTGRGMDLAFGGGGADLIDARLSGGGVANDVTLVGDGFDSSAAYTANGAKTSQVGNDILFGGDGNDTLYGDSADASTAAAGGDDALTGGNGNDSLCGEGGNDILLGDAGNDILVGGRGADRLTGGSGNDTFVFDASASGSDSTMSALDIIYDFARGSDKIDLRAILGAADLFWADRTARAYGVWYGAQGNDTFIYADVNGDGQADLTVRLNGKYTLAVSDFLGVTSGPSPVADTAAVLEGGAAINGNVLTNDSPAGLVVSGVRFGTTNGAVGQNLVGTYGTLRLNADGSYTYTLSSNAAVNALASGQVANEVFTYVASAGGSTATSTLTIVITGTNDVATISGTSAGTVQEDGSLATGGALLVADADAGQSGLQAVTAGGVYGTFVVAANGSWSYTLNNAAGNVQSLRGGQTVQDTLNVASTDGTGTKTLTVNISGSNDAPVAVADTAVTQEDVPVTINVLGNDTDVDSTGLSVLSVSVPAAFGTAAVIGGAIRFTPAANFNGVATFTYVTTDGATNSAPATVTVTVNAVNDAAVISGTQSGAITEDAAGAAVSGDLQVSDVDGVAQAAFVVQSATAGAYGTFSINAAGHWTYSLDNARAATQLLNGGDHPVESFPVQSIDGTTRSVLITVNGSTDVAGRVTDGPVAGATVYLDTNGNGAVDGGDTAVATTDTAGNFHFDTALNPGAFQLLAAGGTDTVTGEVNALVMSAPAGYSYINPLTTLVQAIAESNGGGAAAVAAAQVAVLAAFGLAPGLNLAVTDIYATDLSAQKAAAIVATAATILQEQGSNADPFTALASQVASGGSGHGVDALEDVVQVAAPAALESFQDTVAAVTAAGNVNDIRDALNDNYFNDAPVGVSDAASTSEDVSVTINVLANDTDVDNAAPAGANAGLSIKEGSVSVAGGAATGVALIVANQIQFTPAANFNGTAIISYVATDGALDSAPATVTVNVAPVNDAPYVNFDADDATVPDYGIIDGDGHGYAVTRLGAGNDQAFGIVTLPDGRLLVAGYTTSGSGTGQDFAVARYLAGGQLDTSFGSGGSVLLPVTAGNAADVARAMALQPDGRIVLAGYTTNAATGQDVALVRLNADGSRDATFGTDGIVTRSVALLSAASDVALGVVIQPDGSILTAGWTTPASGTQDLLLMRHTASGALDTSFGNGGIVVTPVDGAGGQDVAQGIALQGDGRILVTGWTYASNTNPVANAVNDLVVARYEANGTLDPTFGGGDGIVTLSISSLTGNNQFENGRSVVALPDGRVLVGGWTTTSRGLDFVLLRFNSDGTPDTTFNGTGYVATPIAPSGGFDLGYALVVQPDGRILLAGSADFGASGHGLDIALVRYNSNGSLDTTFGEGHNGIATLDIGAGNTPEAAFGVVLQPDGRIVVAGFTGVAGSQDFALARFNADGTLDENFNYTMVINENADFGVSIPTGFVVDPDGDALTWTLTQPDGSAPPEWVQFNPATLRVSGHPPVGAADAVLRITATDTGGLSASHVITIRVNEAPVAAAASAATPEDVVLSGNLPVATDAEGDIVIFSLAGQAAHGTVVVNSNGSYSYTPAANYNGSDGFTYRVTDVIDGETGGSRTYTVTISVTPVNDGPPVAAADIAFTNEDVPVMINVLANDTDVDNIAPAAANTGLSIKAGSVSATHGTAAVVGGQIQFTPDAGFHGTASISYQATDGSADSAVATVAVTVNGAPDEDGEDDGDVAWVFSDRVAEGDLYEVDDEDGPSVVDPEGDAFHYELATQASHGTATVSPTGHVTYTPDPTHEGADSFQYRIVDVHGASNTYTIQLNVVSTNQAPQLAAVSGGGSGVLAIPVSQAAGPATDDYASSVVQLADGKLLLAGSQNVVISGTAFSMGSLIRLNADLTPDTSFGGGDGIVDTQIGTARNGNNRVLVQPDGKYLVATNSFYEAANASDLTLVRYNTDGSLDSGFGNGAGYVRLPHAGSDTLPVIALDPATGSIIVAASSGAVAAAGGNPALPARIVMTRYLSDGTLDTSFGGAAVNVTGSGANNFLSIQHAASSGVVDTWAASGSSVSEILVQGDGRIVLVGTSFYNPGSGQINEFLSMRFNANGTLDGGYAYGGLNRDRFETSNEQLNGTNEAARGVIQDSDRRLVVVGISNTNGNLDIAVARYETDGTRHDEFGDQGGHLVLSLGLNSDTSFSVIQQTDGKLVIAGQKNTVPNTVIGAYDPDLVLIRLLEDGSLDTSFGVNGVATYSRPGGVVSSDLGIGLLQQTDGKLVVVGHTGPGYAPVYANSTGDTLIVRFNPDGSVDHGVGDPGVPNQLANESQAFLYQVPGGLFTDPDGDALTYSATLADGSLLPAWLTFNAATRTFSGLVPAGSGNIDVRVTASDGRLSASDVFTISTSGAGNDILLASSGHDDHFAFPDASGLDAIYGFIAGDSAGDVLDLRDAGTGWATFQDIGNHLTQVGANTVLDLGDGNLVTLVGVNHLALNASDFQL